MRTVTNLALYSILTSAFVLTGIEAQAQTWQPPAEADRCPSKWGAGEVKLAKAAPVRPRRLRFTEASRRMKNRQDLRD